MFRGSLYLHEEKLLLASLKTGDRRAFDEIYRLYSRELFLRAYQKTGEREVSEDILQDVFTALWVKRAEIEVRGSLRGYLQGMLDHKVVDHYRQVCMYLKHLDGLIQQFDRPGASPLEQLNYKEQEHAFQLSVAGLSERMRAIFQLSRYEQLSSEEISRRLHLSNQTVRNQISKALKILRARMVHFSRESDNS
ncbi:MAG TPA: sigma-70 family RNA polymerase sigma factor [Puia sp.]|nr:sigma-70 family RNA polymerase sigma factor [Puia sp.]